MLAHEPFEFEQPNMHVEFRLHGVGISLVNNHKCIEVLYMVCEFLEKFQKIFQKKF